MAADEREELVLEQPSVLARLAEPGRDDAECAHALRERFARDVEHRRGRHADDGEIELVADLRDVGVAADARDRVALPVHRIDGSVEVGAQHVAKELSADGAATPRGADDRYGARAEERDERVPDADVVALLDPRLEPRRRVEVESRLEDVLLDLLRHGEARVLEDAAHRQVAGEDVGDELLDPLRTGALRELLEEARAEPARAELVGDGERDLRERPGADAQVIPHGDNALAAREARGRDQGATRGPVRVEDRVDEVPVDRGEAVEAEVERLLREVGEEADEPLLVALARRAQP